MSAIEDATRALNLQAAENSKNAAIEHMAALVREQQYADSCYDPRVVAFKERRREQAGQLRWWKPSNALPKKRRLL